MRKNRKIAVREFIVILAMILLCACAEMPDESEKATPTPSQEVVKDDGKEESTPKPITTETPTETPTDTPSPTEEITPSPTPEPTFTPTPEPTKGAPVMIATDKDWDFTSLSPEAAKDGNNGAYSYVYSDGQGPDRYYIFDFDKDKAFIFSDGEDCTALLHVYGNLIVGANYYYYTDGGPLTLKAKAMNSNYLKEIDIVLLDGTRIHVKRTNYEKAVALMEGQNLVDMSKPTPTPTPIPTATPTPLPTSTPTPTPIPTPTPRPSVLTVDNCPELKKLLSTPPSGAATKTFWDAIGPCTVEIDCAITYAEASGRYLSMALTYVDKNGKAQGAYLICTNVYSFSIKKHNIPGSVLEMYTIYRMRAKFTEYEPQSGQIRLDNMEFWPAD